MEYFIDFLPENEYKYRNRTNEDKDKDPGQPVLAITTLFFLFIVLRY